MKKPTAAASKRHAKPTAMALANRIYRRQLADRKEFRRQFALLRQSVEKLTSGQEMLSQRMESLRVVAEHCNRLIHEKEILMLEREQTSALANQGSIESARQTLKDSAAYMSHPLAEFSRSRTYEADLPGKTLSPSGDWPTLKIPPPGTGRPLHRMTCAFVSSHRPGVPCAVCDYTGTPSDV